MKKLFYLLLLPLLFSTCGKERIFLLEMPYQVQFTIPAGLSPFENWYFLIEDIPTNKNVLFDNAGISDEEVMEILGESARLATFFSNAEYNFIFEVSVRIYKDDPDVDFRELYYRTDLPLNIGNDMDLIGGNTDIQEYLEDGTFNLAIRIIPRQSSPEVIENRLDFILGVR